MLRSACRCTSPIMLRDGVAVCATCGAKVGDDTPAPAVAPSTIVGTRPPLPAPSMPGKSEREARTWARRHGPELLAYGWERTGGKSGQSAVWFGPLGGIERFLADERAKRRRASIAPMVAPAEDDVDRWLRENDLRTTRRSA